MGRKRCGIDNGRGAGYTGVTAMNLYNRKAFQRFVIRGGGVVYSIAVSGGVLRL
jgi:hypothetical protein